VNVVAGTDVTISSAQGSDTTLHMVAQNKHFHDMNLELWEYREHSIYTDLLLVCQGGSMPAHSAVLARLFQLSDIQFVTDEEPQIVLFPNLTLEEVEAALLETYASGSVSAFCSLLSVNAEKKPKKKLNPRKDAGEENEDAMSLDAFDIKPDPQLDDELLDFALKDLEDEEDDAAPLTRRRNKKRKLVEKQTSEPALDTRPFKCDSCKYCAASQIKLEVHRKAKHLGLNKYDCELCNFQTNKQSDMKAHLKTEHDVGTETKRAHTCVHCTEFRATNKKMLDQHIIDIHKNVRKYHCDQCNFSSNYINNFQRHQKAHLGITGNYLCPHCPKAFYVEAKLRSHMLVHSDDKNFVCEECAAKFKRKDDLKVHMKIHLPDEIRAIEKAKKLTKVCETCGKKFEKNWKLKRHMVVHNKDVTVPLEKTTTTAPRWQSNKGHHQPIQEFIVLTSDGKFIETATTEKFIMDRIVVEPKFIEGEQKFIDTKGISDKIVFSQIQYTDA